MNLFDLLSKQITQSDLLNYYNATVVYKSLPFLVDGFVTNYKDINVIVINNELSTYMKKKTILHELSHIELCHLGQQDKELLQFKVKKYEDEADKYIKFLLEQIQEQKKR